MKKRNIVKSSILFNDIMKKGKKVNNDCYIIFYQNKDEELPKYGFAVGKKIGNAVIRNKIKRRIKSIVDEYSKEMPHNNDYIIVAKKQLLDITFVKMKEKFINLIKEIK